MQVYKYETKYGNRSIDRPIYKMLRTEDKQGRKKYLNTKQTLHIYLNITVGSNS